MRVPRLLVSIAAVSALGLLCAQIHAQTRGDFYVSPSGSDSWSGRRATPNRARTDGPFATIKRAQHAVRQLRAEKPTLLRPVTVLLRGGFYALREPIRFSPEDSGRANSPTVYSAYAGERPVLSGGVRLKGWKRAARGWWTLDLPDVAAGRWNFQQLFVNGSRRSRPRLPKSGYYYIEEGLPPSPASEGKGADRFRFREGEIQKGWHDLESVEVLGFQTWTMARLRLQSVDETDRTVTFSGHTAGLAHYAVLPKGNRYLVENVREALGEPGEFYLDRRSGRLTYVPRPGENPERTEVVAPRIDTVVELKGDPEAKKWVSHLQFRGLSFAHTNWTTPRQGHAFPQAEVNLGAALSAQGARDCLFDACRLEHLGAWAVDLGEGCKRNALRNCRMLDLGAGGVKIGLMSAPQDDDLVASHNTVENCTIAHGGRLHPAAVGVWIGHSHHNRVEGNEIADLYYTGVSVGWSWGYGRSLAHHNVIARNHIHDLGQGVLSDMGGIYTLGLSPGTVLRENRIHDVESFDYGGWAIYPDEGSTDILIENNVAFRTKSAPFHQHYGRENLVRNNVFAFGRGAQLMRTREEEHLSFTFERNIVYWREGPLLGSNWSNGKFRMVRNLYWNAAGQPIAFARKTFEEWQRTGQDAGSQVEDPLFTDPTRGDFRLKPNSPAAKTGFQPIPQEVAAPRRGIPVAPPAFPVQLPKSGG